MIRGDIINIIAKATAKAVSKLLEQQLSSMLFEKLNNDWLNTSEAAAYLRISEGNLRTKVSRGQIQVHGRLGNSWRFRRDELDRLLNNPKQGDFND